MVPTVDRRSSTGAAANDGLHIPGGPHVSHTAVALWQPFAPFLRRGLGNCGPPARLAVHGHRSPCGTRSHRAVGYVCASACPSGRRVSVQRHCRRGIGHLGIGRRPCISAQPAALCHRRRRLPSDRGGSREPRPMAALSAHDPLHRRSPGARAAVINGSMAAAHAPRDLRAGARARSTPHDRLVFADQESSHCCAARRAGRAPAAQVPRRKVHVAAWSRA